MRRLTLCCVLLFLAIVSIFAQTITSPTYARRDNVSLSILEIELTPEYTILKGNYRNVMNYGWANINSATFIRDCKTGKRYNIIKSEGLPISPNNHSFTKENEELPFKLYFSAIDTDTQMIDLIEDEKTNSSFNFWGIGLKNGIDRPFIVSASEGHKQNVKPSLSQRINGVKEIQLYVPKALSELDKYIYGNIVKYFQDLGLRVDVVPAVFEQMQQQVNNVTGIHNIFKDDVTDYLKNSNTLCLVCNVTQVAGNNVSDISLTMTFVDHCNGYTWNIQNFSLPNKSDKFINRLKSNITKSYNFNSTYAFVPPSLQSTWNATILKNDIDKNGADPIEGIYKGDKYTLGVKKQATTGKYYIFYIDGADNLQDWKDGDIKCTLIPTASSNIFKGIWYGKWKQTDETNIIFSTIGFVAADKDGEKDEYIKMYPDANTIAKNSSSSGTGFFLSKNGYIVTNYHVIEDAKEIKVTGINEDYKKSYTAEVEVTDKQNDLAIIKIKDIAFKPINIPYTLKFNTSSVGESCFVLGYPLISTMGMDIKLTNGIISSKTGFEGNIAQYQISAPVQPGNSGGPLFDKNGNVIGIVQAKHSQAENVGYAIKASYIRNLVELLPESIVLPQSNLLHNKTLPQQVSQASKAVCVIIVNGD